MGFWTWLVRLLSAHLTIILPLCFAKNECVTVLLLGPTDGYFFLDRNYMASRKLFLKVIFAIDQHPDYKVGYELLPVISKKGWIW